MIEGLLVRASQLAESLCCALEQDTLSAVLGRVAQLVMCLATDASLVADPGVTSLIPAWSHTFVEIDHEIISTVILLPSAESFKKGFVSYKRNMCMKYWLTACSNLPRKKCGWVN